MLKIKNNKIELEEKGICNPNTGILYMPKSQNQIAKELGISKNHLSNILNGKRTCSNELSSKILSYYPDLKFVLYKPRLIVEKVEE